ncbi:FecR domain-containing protein [Curvibacter sp. CHRR-16]|uniref:FecR domain-containing protein n=1 Tax=Curvibacter sp. CHRR-16 TaxID=2835872 RepID=UPI001BDA29AC|nr:FecR domain-containing protein [Curvibacter sp. CHRR-16]MBT0571329.1 FecR domain-containing protein [Curvibacter sp. CHRR-16]
MPPNADHQVLQQAAHWYVQLGSPDCTDQDRHAWQVWLEQDSRHAHAWQRVQALHQHLSPIPKGMSGALTRRPSITRRHAIGGLACALLGWGTWQIVERQTDWLAPSQRYSTERGQRQRWVLPDGSRVLLDTNSAVLVRYGNQQRTVYLERGRIQIETAPDTAANARPFVVTTMHGSIVALGTRFTVQQETGYTRVAVQEHAVQLQPVTGAPLRVEAGQSADLERGDARMRATMPEATAWTTGRLLALQQPLAVFALELSRYSQRPFEVDPQIAQLRISGSFSLDDPLRSMLTALDSVPAQLVEHTHYWQITPR